MSATGGDGPAKRAEGAKPTYLVTLKPEFADLPGYKGRIEVGRTYRAFLSPDRADVMSLIGTDITHAEKRHFDIRPADRAPTLPRARSEAG